MRIINWELSPYGICLNYYLLGLFIPHFQIFPVYKSSSRTHLYRLIAHSAAVGPIQRIQWKWAGEGNG